MIKEDNLKKIQQIAEQVALREGCYLYDLEFVSLGQGRTLRVFIDKEKGIGVEDCARVSRALNLLLDVEDSIPGKYHLEVSSPGLDRPLKLPWHFEKSIGKKIIVKLRASLESLGIEWSHAPRNTKQLMGEVAAVSDGGVVLAAEGDRVSLPFDAIEKARMVFETKSKDKKITKNNRHIEK